MGIRDRLIEVFKDKHIGLTTVIIICGAISADACANIWFVDVMKHKASDEEAISFLKEYDWLVNQCDGIVSAFGQDHDVAKFESSIKHLTDKLHLFASASA
jgi:hypothetical protein